MKQRLIPLSALILSFLCVVLAKWVFVLPRGHLLWDVSLILVAVCVFGSWAVFSKNEDLHNDKG